MKYKTISMVLLLSMMGCGRDATTADYKLAGVGLNPEEIAPTPDNYGGFATYDYIDFAGGALPLGIVGLVSFTGAGPSLGTFPPPYAMVYGSGFFFETATPAPDALFGSFGSAPDQIGSCHTVYAPRSYLSGIADGGSAISFFTENGDGYSIGRRPLAYPPNAAKVFPYYSDLETYHDVSRVWRNPSAKDGTELSGWTQEETTAVNYPFTEDVAFSFKGAIPPESATFGSIPQGYDSALDEQYHKLPSQSRGVMLTWSGVKYSGDGEVMAENGEHSVCLQYSSSGDAPATPVDCLEVATVEAPMEGQFDRGQIYTGP